MDLLQVILLALIGGAAEFLPVSTRAHLFLCQRLHLAPRDKGEAFLQALTLCVRLGAACGLAVCLRRRLAAYLGFSAGRAAGRKTPLELSAASKVPMVAPGRRVMDGGDEGLSSSQRIDTLVMLIVAAVPLAVVAPLAGPFVRLHLERSGVYGWSLLAGGALLLVASWVPAIVITRRMESIKWAQALGVGAAQAVSAVLPGLSRTAATILTGIGLGMGRSAAVEFSLFLAVPSLAVSCGISLFLTLRGAHLPADEILLLVIGAMVSSLAAWVTSALFILYSRRHGFTPFAVYRIALGLAILLWM